MPKPKHPPNEAAPTNKISKLINKLNSIDVGGSTVTDEFLENISMLLQSGMGIGKAVDSLVESSPRAASKRKLQELQKYIRSGYPLWKALKITNVVPENSIELIKLGEESGQLEDKLEFVLLQRQKSKVFRNKILSALAYPVFVLIVTLTVALGIAWFTLPRVTQILQQLRVELPVYTQILMQFGEVMREHGPLVVGGLVFGSIFAVFILFYFRPTRFIGQWILLHIPASKKIIVEVETARMGYSLGNLLKAGLPIDNAIRAVGETSTFVAYNKLYEHLRESVIKGKTIRQALVEYKQSSKLLDSSVQQLLWHAESSGRLEDILIEIGERYEAKLEESAKLLTVMLEPIMLVIVWLVIMGVAISVLMPIYGVIGGLDNARGNATTTQT